MKLTVQEVLALLDQADAVSVDGGPLLSTWEVEEATGDADNQVAYFSWADREYEYSLKLTEEMILQGHFGDSDAFICSETDEDDTEIRFYSLTLLNPNP